MRLGNVIRENGGIELPKSLSLRTEIKDNGCPDLSVVSSGSVVVHNDDILGEVFSYGIEKNNPKEPSQRVTQTTSARVTRRELVKGSADRGAVVEYGMQKRRFQSKLSKARRISAIRSKQNK